MSNFIDDLEKREKALLLGIARMQRNNLIVSIPEAGAAYLKTCEETKVLPGTIERLDRKWHLLTKLVEWQLVDFEEKELDWFNVKRKVDTVMTRVPPEEIIKILEKQMHL